VNTRFYTSAFTTSSFILSVIHGKIEQYDCITFCAKLGKSTIKTLEILREAFWEHLLGWTTLSKWQSCLKAGEVSVEDDERSGQPSTRKWQKSLKNLRTHPWRPLSNNSWACRHYLDQLWSRQEIVTENLNMNHTLLRNLFPNSWQMIDEDPISISGAVLFPKQQMKLMGWCLEIVPDIQREYQVVLDGIKENDLYNAFGAWKKWQDCCIHSQRDYS
jgi:hypothetical protein